MSMNWKNIRGRERQRKKKNRGIDKKDEEESNC